ncbi:MAG TPA: NYN domain-containing protein [Chloroflexota bacterium]|nr:NYN domain-containing protein [Chloroflexota bacterium]
MTNTTQDERPNICVLIDFENMAVSAEQVDQEFDLTPVMELLKTRGRLVIRRAYGDWARYRHFRADLLDHAVDLVQLYRFGSAGKNRADIRLAIDAMEVVFTRPAVDMFAIIAGDSDYSTLVAKLREYGKHTLGIGLRHATGDLLVKSCDEFLFYEALVGRELGGVALDGAQARELLVRALRALQHQGALPVYATKLKQTMVALDSTFNEATLGHEQFAGFLRTNSDLVQTEYRNKVLYVALAEGALSTPELSGKDGQPWPPAAPALGAIGSSGGRDGGAWGGALPLSETYRHQLRRGERLVVEPTLRRTLLGELHDLLTRGDDELTLNRAAEVLRSRDEATSAPRPKGPIVEVCKLALLGDAVALRRPRAGLSSPAAPAANGDSDAFRRAAEAVYVQKVAEAGLELSFTDLSLILFDTATEASAVEAMLAELRATGRLTEREGGRFGPPADWAAALQLPTLASAVAELDSCALATDLISPGTARALFEAGNAVRGTNFAQASERYLRAARLQLEAIRRGAPGAGREDFWWYFANFLATRAGAAFSEGRYPLAVPYYLAFFALLREGEPLWDQVFKLVNVMLSYYFATAAKQVGISPGRNPGYTHPTLMAVLLHNHPEPAVAARWQELAVELARTNPALVEQMLEYASLTPADPMLVNRTAAVLRELLNDWYAAPMVAAEA